MKSTNVTATGRLFPAAPSGASGSFVSHYATMPLLLQTVAITRRIVAVRTYQVYEVPYTQENSKKNNHRWTGYTRLGENHNVHRRGPFVLVNSSIARSQLGIHRRRRNHNHNNNNGHDDEIRDVDGGAYNKPGQILMWLGAAVGSSSADEYLYWSDSLKNRYVKRAS